MKTGSVEQRLRAAAGVAEDASTERALREIEAAGDLLRSLAGDGPLCRVALRAACPGEHEDGRAAPAPRSGGPDALPVPDLGPAPDPRRIQSRRRASPRISRRSFRWLILLAASGRTYEIAVLLFLAYVAVHFVRKGW